MSSDNLHSDTQPSVPDIAPPSFSLTIAQARATFDDLARHVTYWADRRIEGLKIVDEADIRIRELDAAIRLLRDYFEGKEGW